jgi:hypothetical protein
MRQSFMPTVIDVSVISMWLLETMDFTVVCCWEELDTSLIALNVILRKVYMKSVLCDVLNANTEYVFPILVALDCVIKDN